MHLVPDQGLNSSPVHCEHRVLTGPPGKYSGTLNKNSFSLLLSPWRTTTIILSIIFIIIRIKHIGVKEIKRCHLQVTPFTLSVHTSAVPLSSLPGIQHWARHINAPHAPACSPLPYTCFKVWRGLCFCISIPAPSSELNALNGHCANLLST